MPDLKLEQNDDFPDDFSMTVQPVPPGADPAAAPQAMQGAPADAGGKPGGGAPHKRRFDLKAALSSLPTLGKKPASFTVLSDAASYDPAQPGQYLILGQVVFATMKEAAPPPNFFAQQTRTPHRKGLGDLLGSEKRKINVSVDARLFNGDKATFALALDGYLAWGLKARDVTVLIGGVEGLDRTTLAVMTFKAGTLLAMEERRLPGVYSAGFIDSVGVLVREINVKHPGARIVLADPLTDWGVENVRHIGALPLKGLKFERLRSLEAKKVSYLAPVAMGLVGVGSYVAMGGSGYIRYESAVSEYQQAATRNPAWQSAPFDPGALDQAKSRAALLAGPPTQAELMPRLGLILKAVAAQPGARLADVEVRTVAAGKELTGRAQEQAGSAADEAIVIRGTLVVPASSDPPFEQGRQVLSALSARTGLLIRLVPEGWLEKEGRRSFRIEVVQASRGAGTTTTEVALGGMQ